MKYAYEVSAAVVVPEEMEVVMETLMAFGSGNSKGLDNYIDKMVILDLMTITFYNSKTIGNDNGNDSSSCSGVITIISQNSHRQ